ncbi:MAG TPA: hypothetical protein VJU14_10035 [Solirubrobacterales bacterium]|nr:hypothetical protein [Solirubrobacterales bacterium]
MGRGNRGDGGKALREAAGDPEAFARCSRRLERAIDSSCDAARPWAEGVAAAIVAGLRFAEAEPVAARVVVVHSAFRRYGAAAGFAVLVDELAARLGDGAPPVPHPERTAHNVVLRVMRQTLLQLELGGEGPTAIAAELVVYALTPYLGLREAQRWAAAVTGELE